MNEYDVVVAKRDLSTAVKQGDAGTIVMVFEKPYLAYEVEFFDDDNETTDILTVNPDDIEKII